MDQVTALLLLAPFTRAVKNAACPADRVVDAGERDNVGAELGTNDITALPIFRGPLVAVKVTV